MIKLSNIDIAYEYLKEKKESTTFLELVELVMKNPTNKGIEKTKLMTSLYTTLVCDNRFSLTTDGLWALRSNPKIEDIKKQLAGTLKTIDSNEDEENTDEDEDEFTSLSE